MVNVNLNHKLLETWGKDFFLKMGVMPFLNEKNEWIFAFNEYSETKRSYLKWLFKEPWQGVNLSKDEWNDLLNKKERSKVGEPLISDLQTHRFEIEASEQDQAGQSLPIIRLNEKLVLQAIQKKSTDIHFEPMQEQMKVRFRIDGVLHTQHHLPHWVVAPLISHIKILAKLDISEKRLPQDGKISWQSREGDFDIRVSSLPTHDGEKVVMRLLPSKSKSVDWKSLGFEKGMSEKVLGVLQKPQGMIVVTGPTGSGKSSTLYAGLQMLDLNRLNVSTIEDPIEYHLHGANQVQVNEKAGLSFASALRSLLRQDPDVILVGEIRDVETARISIQAAQTGHLVLSTLHTNDALSAITRLKDLGVAPFLISSSILGVLAQRLVRVLCTHCKTKTELTSLESQSFPELKGPIYKSVGCEHCNQEGYVGRTAIFEWLSMSDDLQSLIEEDATATALKEKADWIRLREDAIDKIKAGITDLKEVARVISM